MLEFVSNVCTAHTDYFFAMCQYLVHLFWYFSLQPCFCRPFIKYFFICLSQKDKGDEGDSEHVPTERESGDEAEQPKTKKGKKGKGKPVEKDTDPPISLFGAQWPLQ